MCEHIPALAMRMHQVTRKHAHMLLRDVHVLTNTYITVHTSTQASTI